MNPTPPSLAKIRPFSKDFNTNLLLFIATGGALSLFFQKNYGSCGDYPQHVSACVWGLGIGAVTGMAFNLLHDRFPYAWRLQPLLKGFLRYYLAAIMLTCPSQVSGKRKKWNTGRILPGSSFSFFPK